VQNDPVGSGVDAVIVSYNSSRTLRRCVESLLEHPAVRVIVVDNNSTDGAPDTVADLPVDVLRRPDNRGFAHGCNIGWKHGSSPYVLLLNPDATIDRDSLSRLLEVLEREPAVGMSAPRILDADGSLEFSQRRFPRVASTFSNALFVHRLFPRATWTDELIRDAEAYEKPGSPDWVSGACMLLPRPVIEQIAGLDEGFFLYGEDVDLCRRVRAAGYDIRYVPDAAITHIGGASAPRGNLLPVLADSRIRYSRLHDSRLETALSRIGISLGALTHALLSTGGSSVRRGHARAFARSLRPG
jgi:N-acetylglucosaminyl-diphospho-decaprenol L-rhamnosyltransferase